MVVFGCANGALGILRLPDLRLVVKLVDQHTSGIVSLATADGGGTLVSGSTKVVIMDLKATVGHGKIVASVEAGDYHDQ